MATAFNFGPQLEAHRSVRELVVEALLHWPGSWVDQSDPGAPHEASLLNLVIDKVSAAGVAMAGKLAPTTLDFVVGGAVSIASLSELNQFAQSKLTRLRREKLSLRMPALEIQPWQIRCSMLFTLKSCCW